MHRGKNWAWLIWWSRQMNKVIKLLQPTAFRTFKGWVSHGNINPVFVASMQINNGKKQVLQDVYCKIYPFTTDDRSLFNEIVGHLVANALGVPQPTHAYIALMDINHILNNNVDNQLPNELVLLLKKEQYYPVFCTAKIDKSQTAFDFHGWTPSLINEMSKWKYLPDTLAMDNTIAHTDRHLNNILRTGRQTYHVIDNGRLATEDGTPWQPTNLDSSKVYSNKLWTFSELSMQKSWKTISINVLHVCTNHANAVNSCLEEINFWIKSLYNEQQMDYNSFIDFLLKRANDSEYYHAQRLHLLT